MIEIKTTSEVKNNNIANVKCMLNVNGRRYAITCELAGALETFEENYPGLIGDALELMIAKAREKYD